MSARYVVVTGSVAAGATTASELIMENWNAESLLEGQIEENNPFFGDAQADPHRWSFASQAHFLAASGARHTDLKEQMARSEADFIVEDRTPFEHHGAYSRANFELGYLSNREFALLSDLAREIERGYLAPDVFVYREMTDAQLVARVRQRGRVGESDDAERLRVIHRAFESFIGEWDRTPIVRVPADLDLYTEDGTAAVIALLSEHLGSPTK